MELDPEGSENLLTNMEEYFKLDASEDVQYQDGLRRLKAITMVFDDLLVQAGRREPLTPIEEKARIKNPYYRPVGILPIEGNSP